MKFYENFFLMQFSGWKLHSIEVIRFKNFSSKKIFTKVIECESTVVKVFFLVYLKQGRDKGDSRGLKLFSLKYPKNSLEFKELHFGGNGYPTVSGRHWFPRNSG